MKTFILTLISSLFILNLNAQGGDFTKNECQVHNLTFENVSDSSNAIFPYIIDEDRKGLVDLHSFTMDEIGGWEIFVNSLIDDEDISFSLIGTKESRLYSGMYHRFQQFYNGVPVDDGGFTILVDSDDPQAYIGPPCDGCPVGPPDPCGGAVKMIAPHIYEGIDISTSPSINNSNIENYLEGLVLHVDSTQLNIVNNLKKDCEYELVYKVVYTTSEDGELVGWIDANTGETLYKTSQHNYKNAPTADFGTQFMNDQVDGNETVLQNDRLRAYDMTGNITRIFWSNDIPRSPVTRDWNCNNQQDCDASPEVFQLFWMTDQVIDEFDTQLGIEFEDVWVGYKPSFGKAVSKAPGIPSSTAKHVFGGDFQGNSMVEFDVVGHELGHTIIREFISSPQYEGGALHEAIADMFGVYVESILEPSGLDWVMGDDIPGTVRDLENTTRNCFSNIQHLREPHERSEALGHWFYLCVNGDAANNIPPMNIDEVVSLVYEALPNLGNNPDYPDLMEVVMDLTIDIYGTCSDQFLSILRSWEQICVPTGHRMANPNAPCAVLNENSFVCEENNYFIICLASGTGFDAYYADWTISGKNSTTFESKRGMQGNSQHGGNCIEVNVIPEMPYYPQTISVKFKIKDLNGDYIHLTERVTIGDCDGDDLTCEEYYDQNIAQRDDNDNIEVADLEVQTRASKSLYETGELKLIVFDMMGNKVEITENMSSFYQHFGSPKILIYTYWNQSGMMIKSKKVFVH